jgi:hypothetical protein
MLNNRRRHWLLTETLTNAAVELSRCKLESPCWTPEALLHTPHIYIPTNLW